MRATSATLTANQAGVGVTGLGYKPIWKLVLSRAGQATKTYTKSRIISISHPEEEYNQSAIVLLNNADNALTSLDFEMYKGIISYGYNDPDQGDEYSPCAPLYVLLDNKFSAQGVLVCQLYLIGIPNLMGMDKAESELDLTDGDVRTVKDLITAVANASLTPYSNYTNYTVTYDSEDNIIDSFKPKESFQVSINENRLEKIKQLLGWTGNKMRAEDDGALHTFNPTTTGSSYDNEYKLLVSGEHTFFNKELINRFVNPNKTIVESREAHDPQYSGSATSATSYAIFPKTETIQLWLASDTEAANISSARIETHELDADKGAVKVPMNVGQEIFDYIKVTDSRQGDSRVGNVRYLRRNVRAPRRRGEKLIFNMDIRFGKIPTLAAGPFLAGLVSEEISIEALAAAILQLQDNITQLAATTAAELDEIRSHMLQHHNLFFSRKIIAGDSMTIPVE